MATREKKKKQKAKNKILIKFTLLFFFKESGVMANFPDSISFGTIVLTLYMKINSKWIKDLNVRAETIKLSEENIGSTLSDINHSKILYDPPPRVMEIKIRINRCNLIQLESFCAMIETISKEKRQLQNRRK